jgi:hypothetical protein
MPSSFAGGEDLDFGAPPQQGVFVLDRRDRLDGVGATDRGCGGFGHPEVLDLAGLDEFLHGAGDVLDGNVGVDAVLVEEVERVDLQAREGGVGDLFDVVGSARQSDELAVVVDGESELGGDHDFAA